MTGSRCIIRNEKLSEGVRYRAKNHSTVRCLSIKHGLMENLGKLEQRSAKFGPRWLSPGLASQGKITSDRNSVLTARKSLNISNKDRRTNAKSAMIIHGSD